MVRGKPDHSPAVRRMLEAALDPVAVVQQVAVREHHPPRCRRRARGVLQEGEALFREWWFSPGLRCFVGELVTAKPTQRVRTWRLNGKAVGGRVDRWGREHGRRTGVANDR